ncbi:syndecan-4-like [Salmo salar]|uniref:Syndecan n=1 Tax=Salmo salar TaxID=8030 RepID=A0A1S3L7W7_SALSA|nr:syndecan-4-like [Salmo salar]|eukprot:XP_013987062.1 PREDICTED: syndecan-4-like [Salmo salar]
MGFLSEVYGYVSSLREKGGATLTVSQMTAPYIAALVWETETWMPMKTTQAVFHDELISSGDSANGSDFGFPDEEHDTFDNEDKADDNEDYDNFSGSGDGGPTITIKNDKPSMNNKIPDLRLKPTVNEIQLVQKNNEVLVRVSPKPEEHPSNVLMAHAGEESIFNKTEVLAALIAGGAVGLFFAVLLILLLVYRMKKKDEGSYDLGKKPIYKKAPTTEVYA